MKGRGIPAVLMIVLAVTGCQMGMVLGLIAPEAPKGLAASEAGSGSLSISWIRSQGATSYQVFRDVSPAGAFSTLAYSGSDSSFTDSGLQADTTYWYRVRASSAAGSSDPTAAVSAALKASVPSHLAD